jgi:putative ATP-binding cassette transporter
MRGLGPFLRDAWRLAKPYFNAEEKWSARGLLLIIVVLNLSMVGMSVVLNYWNRLIYNSLQDKDWGSFISLLFWYKKLPGGFLMPGFCEIAVVFILVAVYRTYLNQWLQIRWRRWMTDRFIDDWLADRAFYRVSLATSAQGTGTDNPDQRIAEDVRSFVSDTLSLGLDLLSNVVTLFSFLSILWELSGSLPILGLDIPGYMVWVALLYSIAGSGLAHWIGRPLVALNFFQQRVEANFRFALVRLRENVEGVALYGGEREEKRGLVQDFSALMANWWAIMRRMKGLNAFVAGFGQVASVFPLVVASPRFFAGVMDLGTLFQTVDAFGQVQGAMSWFVSSYSALASWRATVERLATFHRAIQAAHAHASEGVTNETSEGTDFGLSHVTLTLPDGQTLLQDVNLPLHPGTSVVIQGRSGTGKSTLFRALAGIWPFGTGHVRRPAGSSLFLPQRPYIPLGTLRHAVAYPLSPGDFDDAEIMAALTDAGLAHLAPRLDDTDSWSQRLSGGEQQRLALARALLVKPDWLFLDEATASLDPQSEAELYATLKRRLPGTTIISIAHRDTIAALHDRRIIFERETGHPGRLADAAN